MTSEAGKVGSMHIQSFLNSDFFSWGILPILIFLARIGDVSIGTVRIMLISRGKRFLAPCLGFFEMMVWLLAVRQIFFNMTNWVCYFAFAFGFAAGNFVGILIEEKLAMGLQVIRIITQKDAEALIESMKSFGFGVTVVDGKGAMGKVNVIFTIVKRCDQFKVIELIKQFNPKAFYSIEDIRGVSEGVFPGASRSRFLNLLRR